ncbi:MAG TPA: thioesterase family protein [Blastocatellia bacterium]|jgi:acyl-CoA thioester hydrolase|nr:thioesterase family protein [Blastocatellia bacterium]
MFETRVQTYWDDSDAAGMVYFAHFFRFAEYAEAELFRSTGTERMKLYNEYDVWMPRVESFAKFSKPIRAEEAIFVRIRTRFKGEKTVRMEFEILSVPDRSLLAEGYVTAVCIDRKSSKSRPLPPAMREVFSLAAADTQE